MKFELMHGVAAQLMQRTIMRDRMGGQVPSICHSSVDTTLRTVGLVSRHLTDSLICLGASIPAVCPGAFKILILPNDSIPLSVTRQPPPRTRIGGRVHG